MKRIIFTYGIAFGLIISVSSYLYMTGGIGNKGSMGITFGSLIISLVLAGMAYKKSQDGFASFGELIKLFLGVSVLGILLSTIISVAYVSMMDEDTKNTVSQKVLDNALSMYESMGMSQDQIDMMSDELEKRTDSMFSIGALIQASVINIFLYFIISLIPAGIMKKN